MQKEKPNTADEKKKTEEVKTEENKPRETEMNRNYKDSLFCRLFSDKERALSLYNAINGTVIIPGLSEPPVRTLRATIPENESH